MRKEIDNYVRQETFNAYHGKANPFIHLVSKIDITNLMPYAKKYGSYYATIAFALHLAVMEMDCFKYRYEEGKIVYYTDLALNFVHNVGGGEDIVFFDVDYTDYKSYIANFFLATKRAEETKQSYAHGDGGEIWYSCVPWFNFSALVTPFNENDNIPQFVWDKFIKENGKTYVNLYIQIHHGFCNGSDLGEFFKRLEEKNTNFEKYIK